MRFVDHEAPKMGSLGLIAVTPEYEADKLIISINRSKSRRWLKMGLRYRDSHRRNVSTLIIGNVQAANRTDRFGSHFP
jgi:hypothetical protein